MHLEREAASHSAPLLVKTLFAAFEQVETVLFGAFGHSGAERPPSSPAGSADLGGRLPQAWV